MLHRCIDYVDTSDGRAVCPSIEGHPPVAELGHMATPVQVRTATTDD